MFWLFCFLHCCPSFVGGAVVLGGTRTSAATAGTRARPGREEVTSSSKGDAPRPETRHLCRGWRGQSKRRGWGLWGGGRSGRKKRLIRVTGWVCLDESALCRVEHRQLHFYSSCPLSGKDAPSYWSVEDPCRVGFQRNNRNILFFYVCLDVICFKSIQNEWYKLNERELKPLSTMYSVRKTSLNFCFFPILCRCLRTVWWVTVNSHGCLSQPQRMK